MLRPWKVQMHPAPLRFSGDTATSAVSDIQLRMARMEKFLSLSEEDAARVRAMLVELLIAGEASERDALKKFGSVLWVAVQKGLVRLSLSDRVVRVTDLGQRFMQQGSDEGGDRASAD